MTLNRRTLIIQGTCAITLASTYALPATAQDTLSTEEKAMLHLLLSVTENKNIRAVGGGGYNYADPSTQPYQHFQSDIQPWIMMGSSRGDSSSPKSRAKAYIADIAEGINEARKIWPSLTPDNIKARGNKNLPPAWSRAMENEKARKIFDMIDGTDEIDKKSLKSATKAIRKAL